MRLDRTLVSRLFVLASMTVALTGCWTMQSGPGPSWEDASKNPFIPANRAAATALLANTKGALLPDATLIVATLVDINQLERSSTLGRVVSEQISGAFSKAGFRMIEMKFREKVYMKRNEGELLLTREITDVAKQHNAQAVIVGTYGVAADTIFLNLKVVQPGTNLVLSAHDYALPMDRNMSAMLSTSR
jgi:TolB-like protein